MAQVDPGITIIYDGECPFCKEYCRLLTLKERVGPVNLIDARKPGIEVQEAQNAGYDLNEGMIVTLNDQTYHGADAVHILALYSEPNDLWNRLNIRLFRSKRLGAVIYPILRFCRNLTLKVLGRKPISSS